MIGALPYLMILMGGASAAVALSCSTPTSAETRAKEPPREKPQGPARTTGQKAANMSLYDLSTNLLNGQPKNLGDFKGQVTLVVNTASECGFTPQYDGLEKLHETYKARGFSVLGFPSNDFGGQEPGTAEQIATFCSTRFHVAFPLFQKVKTKGEGQSPVFQFVSATGGEPKWNFYKYLVGKDGKVIQSFASKVEPLSPELTGAIEAALKK